MRARALTILALMAVPGWGLAARADPIPYTPDNSIAALDARSPDDVATVLRLNGVTGELKVDEVDTPYFVGDVRGMPMIAAFFDCNVALSRCRRVLFEAEVDGVAASDDAVTAWGVSSPACGADVVAPGRVWIWRLVRSEFWDTGVEATAEQRAWLACVEQFKQVAGGEKAGAEHP